LALLKSEGTLFRQLVEARIKTLARFRHKEPTEMFEGDLRFSKRADLLLGAADLAIEKCIPWMWRQRYGKGVGLRLAYARLDR
jgi:hypothetical protein